MAATLDLTVTKVANSGSIDSNNSKVQIVLKITTSNGTWNHDNDTSGYIKIDGKSVVSLDKKWVDLNTTTTLYIGTHTITHDEDGSKTISVEAAFDVNTSTRWIYATKKLTLDTIPRASTLDSLSCATSYFTGTMTYKYTPKSSAMYNRCNISLHLGDEFISVKSVNLGKKTAAQQTATVTLTEAELATVYNRLTSSPPKGTLRFTFRTYSDSGYSVQVGDYAYKEITLSIPDDKTTKPTVGMSLVPVSSLPDAFDGLYIKGKTRVKATLASAPKYNAKISSYSVTVDGVSYDSGDSYTSAILSKYGSVAVTGYATDSRGFTGSMPVNITVIDYAKPKIMNVEVFRCDADGNASDNGTYLKIKAKRNYSPVTVAGVQKNFCLIRYRWKSAQGEYGDWATILDRTAAGDEVTTDALLDGALAVNATYHVQVQAVDDIGEYAETTLNVHTEAVYMHRTKNAMGLGKYAEGENLLDVAWDTHFHGDVMIGDMSLREYILSIIEGG